ncbi:MAG: hypothetical protein AAF533_29565 [Acidobacteriota bacterium]
MTTSSRRLHLRHRAPLALRDALQRLELVHPTSVAWPRGAWTTVLVEAPALETLEIAQALSHELSCPAVVKGPDEAAARLVLVRDGLPLGAIALDDPDLDPMTAIPDDFADEREGDVSEDSLRSHPQRETERSRQTLSFVQRMQEQVRLEVISNVTWLRRHAELLGIDGPLPDEPDRKTEGALMSGALATLRSLESGPSADEADAAREELRRLQREQQAVFHELVGDNAELLDVPTPPDPKDSPETYFATAGRALTSAGDDDRENRGAAVPTSRMRLAARLGLDPTLLEDGDEAELGVLFDS